MTSSDQDLETGAASLLDTPAEQAFDRITRLVSRIVGVPVALVTVLDRDRQFFKSQIGLPAPWSDRRETPLSHSFCRIVVETGASLVIESARDHPLVSDNLAIPDLGVEAYLGFPFRAADGTVIGSLCAIDRVPRTWTADEIAAMSDLSEMLETELSLREEVLRRQEAEATQLLMMQEMEHRLKNSLAKVQAIVSLSMRHGGDMAEMRTALTQRIASLAKTQSLLVNANWQATSIREILEGELGHYGRLSLTGDMTAVTSEDAVLVGMIAHELGTNAVKYGAIVSEGDIHVEWRETTTEEGRRLRLIWTETGVDLRQEPTSKGFGTKLLEALVIRQSKGTIQRDWHSTGLVLTADFAMTPLPEAVARAAGTSVPQA